MRHLEIHNFGPIKHVSIDLKRYNFIIGPQSSGKSTIVKVLSTCMWIEKEVCTTLNEHVITSAADFKQLLEGFHKMENYFEEDTRIEYETEFVRIEYRKDDFSAKTKDGAEYQRNKICYIPAERNMVTLPELQGFEFGQTNLRSFLFDWFNAREFYAPDNKVDVLNLGVKYYYSDDEKRMKDRIEHVNGKTYHIALSSASSGLQSVIPLLIMMQYYTSEYFNSYEEKMSFDENSKIRKLRRTLADKFVLNAIKPGFAPEERAELAKMVNDKVYEGDPYYIGLYSNFLDMAGRLTIPAYSSFIIEEPEQNLYPSTQMDLLGVLIGLCQGKRAHDVTITTHSPYILNQLNLLIMRNSCSVGDKPTLCADDMCVLAVQNGGVMDLKQTNTVTGMMSVNAEWLNEAMRDMYSEYRELKVKGAGQC